MLVTKDTDLCIEGFPRSANSFTAGMIAHSEDNTFKIAGHTHAPAQIIRACRLQVPTLVLIRNPFNTIISLRGLQLEVNMVENNHNHVTDLIDLLRDWIKFYQTIYPQRDYFVIGLFENITEDLAPTIERLNSKFDLALNISEKDLEPIKRRGYHALPSERRDNLKKQARHDFDQIASGKSELIEKAQDLFNWFKRTVENYESV
jgi:hypothetical protein